MKNPNSFALIFPRIEGQTLIILQTAIQKRLFEFGYVWNGNGSNVAHTNEPNLVFNVYPHEARIIHFTSGFRKEDYGRIFDASSELEAFFQYAKNNLKAPIIQVIDGCVVTIKSNDIQINMDALIASVKQKAEAIQKENWSNNQ